MFTPTPEPKPNDPRDYCRLCGHAEVRHTGEIFQCGYVAPFLTLSNYEEFCPCSKFVPSDNLEFLELKVKQKEDEILHI